MAEPPIPTATQLSAKVEFLNTLGEMQDNIATTSILTHDSQKNELEMLRSHRWHVVRLLVGAVVVIALLLLANILMLPRVYPVLFCWWRSHYKVLGRSCKPSPVEGAFQVSA